MDSIEVYLGLGTNEGDRYRNIEIALKRLSELGILILKVSDIIETEPWGFECSQRFLNCVVRGFVNVGVAPETLLKICKSIETELGRKEDLEYDSCGKRVYHSRPIDIDILFYGVKIIDTEQLTIPHKGIKERDFVMIPLLQVISEDIKSAFPELFGKKSLHL